MEQQGLAQAPELEQERVLLRELLVPELAHLEREPGQVLQRRGPVPQQRAVRSRRRNLGPP